MLNLIKEIIKSGDYKGKTLESEVFFLKPEWSIQSQKWCIKYRNDLENHVALQMKNGKEFLLTDTVGFIQKLPTTLVSYFSMSN